MSRIRMRVQQIPATDWTVKIGTAGLWKWRCPIERHSGDEADRQGWGYTSIDGAASDAAAHARACDSFRLALLLERLEGLRDHLEKSAYSTFRDAERYSRSDVPYGAYLGGFGNARHQASSSLTNLITEATR